MNLTTLEGLPIRDAKNLWSLYSQGLAGPFKEYIIGYNTQVQAHNQQQLYLQVNSKKHKTLPFSLFEEMYPIVYRWMMLDQVVKKIEPNRR